MTYGKPNVILEKSILFSVSIIAFCELLDERRKYVVSRQLLRSGTSIGANVFEAQQAESDLDFIHKMKIANKEASETLYWLILCDKCSNYPKRNDLLDATRELIRIISKIILTTKEKKRLYN